MMHAQVIILVKSLVMSQALFLLHKKDFVPFY